MSVKQNKIFGNKSSKYRKLSINSDTVARGSICRVMRGM